MRLITLLVVVLFCACRTYIPYHPQVTHGQIPTECSDLVDFVKRNWKQHRRLACHKHFENVVRLTSNYKNCLKQLNQNQIEELLGKPDEVIAQESYYYLFKKKCENNKEVGAYFLQISFKDKQVFWIDSGEMEYKEIIEK